VTAPTPVDSGDRWSDQHRCDHCKGSQTDPHDQGRRCGGFKSSIGPWFYCTNDHVDQGRCSRTATGYQHSYRRECACGHWHGRRGVTIEQLAAAKGFEPDELVGWGCRDVSYKNLPAVAIAHITPTNEVVWHYRLDLEVEPRFEWQGGVHAIPYGLEFFLNSPHLDEAVLVEGETNDWAFRKINIPVLAVPGGSVWDHELLDRCFKNVKRIKVGIDQKGGKPDGGGESMRLQASKAIFRDRVWLFQCDPHKAAHDVYYADAVNWKANARVILDRAQKLTEWEQSIGSVFADHGDQSRSESATAERFVKAQADGLRFCRKFGSWLAWEGARWSHDNGWDRAMAAAKHVADALWRDVDLVAKADVRLRREMITWARHMSSEPGLRRMITLAEGPLIIAPDQFDVDPLVLNVRNGLIDLRAAKIRPAKPADHITKLVPVVFDPKAACPDFKQFLIKIFKGDEAMIAYIARVCGYACTGDFSERIFWVWHGDGKNGKSVLAKLVARILGDYAVPSRPATFMVKRSDAIPNDVAELRGARFIPMCEGEEGQTLAAGLVKSWTGGDTQKARFLHKEWFSLDPVGKPVFATNYKPTIKDVGEAMWDRVHLVPFEFRIPDDEQDLHFGDKLFAKEASGILNWLLAGCLDWQKNGLQPPPKVLTATEEYREEQKPLAAFIFECADLNPDQNTWKTYRENAGTLQEMYLRWHKSRQVKSSPLRGSAWTKALEEIGLVYDRDATHRWWQGIKLRVDVCASLLPTPGVRSSS
jgi:putative DNA primase/helicase